MAIIHVLIPNMRIVKKHKNLRKKIKGIGGVRSFVKNKVPITKLYSRGNKKITDSTDSQGSDMGWLRR